ncbi:16S rRNA (cytosine(1407)-C(5))-methyltransferase RsmF [Pseudoalteromonas sp. SR43-6]|uniref:16S rRNA (cytosine(1407)-C(5))-methyltransferase RsmF n=1 Tax=unclassified Pseudoalteromonas TaxID=194690 RepID=UPI0015FC3DF8|nr:MULTISPECIES: 16S rRNA (cytosine(1407)-C(5))-methyltransferase RsmF [unclassified Pseudoalteromonas]MBB1288043.1 16S rRNA (cytosine(1407)-C(5))-methyltransferase RsmF [Pseudoalteromonas sp. SR41-5]MBB1372827.1 16S rRNA (cytosine(1407)-C(5))-methyltransferase RsmF [Pseudoalteromonas sp. SR43-6]MBB1412684.1 16S rRNA (cytosine(1407)-C(5))-methyltransferase RsmF [Pseudoalteromonas sp. SG43-8]
MNANTFIPEHFIDDVKTYLPAHLNLDDFLNACRRPLRKSIRVNTLKISIEEFIKRATEKNWLLTPIPWCSEGFWLERPSNEEQNLALGNTDLHLSGAMYVQEASSMLPPIALKQSIELAGSQSSTVLDMASAPGSKTSQLAALMNNQGVLVANELSSSRLKVLSATLKRMGVGNCALSHFDGIIFGNYMFECFDNILLDAPCSGEGTVRKDADALKNWSIESNIQIAQVQKDLIKSAFYALKPGGTLVYSTCTLTPLENQQVCDYLLSEFGDYIEPESLSDLFEGASKATTTEGYLHVWPQTFDSEGFFIAKFKKRASCNNPNQTVKKGAFPFNEFDKKQSAAFMQSLKKHFGLTNLPGSLMQRDKELWLFPEGFEAVQNKIKYARLGIQIGIIHKNGVRLTHEFATVFGNECKNNVFALNNEQANDYFQGKDIRLTKATQTIGEVVLTLCGCPIGLGKWQKNKIKNSLPRDLVQNTQLISWV